jgi:hypothetical protein
MEKERGIMQCSDHTYFFSLLTSAAELRSFWAKFWVVGHGEIVSFFFAGIFMLANMENSGRNKSSYWVELCRLLVLSPLQECVSEPPS